MTSLHAVLQTCDMEVLLITDVVVARVGDRKENLFQVPEMGLVHGQGLIRQRNQLQPNTRTRHSVWHPRACLMVGNVGSVQQTLQKHNHFHLVLWALVYQREGSRTRAHLAVHGRELDQIDLPIIIVVVPAQRKVSLRERH